MEKLGELKERGTKDLLERNQHGHSALDFAALLGKDKLVQLLLEYGAEVNDANKSGTAEVKEVEGAPMIQPY